MAFARGTSIFSSAALAVLLSSTVSQARCNQTCSMIEKILSDRSENFSKFDSDRTVNGLHTPTVVIPGFDFCDFNSVDSRDGRIIPDFECMIRQSVANAEVVFPARFTATRTAIQAAVDATHPDWTWHTNADGTKVDVGPSGARYVVRLYYLWHAPTIEILSSPAKNWMRPVQHLLEPCG